MSRLNSSLAYDEVYSQGTVPSVGMGYEPELTLLVKKRTYANFAHASSEEVIMIGGSITVSF